MSAIAVSYRVAILGYSAGMALSLADVLAALAFLTAATVLAIALFASR